MTERPVGLKRTLTLRDLILLNIVAVYTPSSLSQSLQLGVFGIAIWLLASITFMLPYGAAIAGLSARYPMEGGIYAWTRLAFGDRHGFLCGWSYWANTFLYLPSIFLSIAAVLALLGGGGTAWIEQHQFAVVSVACIALWIATALSIVGLGTGKWLQNVGAVGRLMIAVGLLSAAAWTLLHRTAGESLTMPRSQITGWYSLALWPFVLNALVGLELGSAMSEEVNAPARDIPRSLAIGGAAVAITYLLSFAAALVNRLPETNVMYGHVQTITDVIASAGSGTILVGLAGAVVLCELLGLIGNGTAWLAAPARIPFAIGLDHYLPRAFGRVHPRFGTPYIALLAQATAATCFIVVSTYGAALQEAFVVLLSASIILILIPYVYLFLSWLRLAAAHPVRNESLHRVRLVAGVGLTATLAALAACLIPPPVVTATLGYEIKLLGAAGLMLAVGGVLYAAGSRIAASGERSRAQADSRPG